MTRRTSLRAALPALLAVSAALALSGCGGTRASVGKALGLTYESPDPFNVAPRAPLRLPSDLAALPAPQPGAASPLDPAPAQSARAALGGAGAPVAAGAAPSPGEMALLDASGAAAADPGVRAALAADAEPERESRYGLSSIFGYVIPDGSESEVLRPREEAERLTAAGGAAPAAPPAPAETPTDEIEFLLSE